MIPTPRTPPGTPPPGTPKVNTSSLKNSFQTLESPEFFASVSSSLKPCFQILIFQTDNRTDVDYLALTKLVNNKMSRFLNENIDGSLEYKHLFHLMEPTQYENIHPATGKINVVYDLLNEREEEILVFLDSDAWIQNPHHLNELIQYLLKHPEKQGCFSRDPYLSRNDYINSGSFILRINDYTRNMYKEIKKSLEENDSHHHKWSYDQHYISKYIHEKKDDFIIFIPHIINTPEGQILRHHWWKTYSMFQDLYGLLDTDTNYKKPEAPYFFDDKIDDRPYPNPNTYDYEYKR